MSETTFNKSHKRDKQRTDSWLTPEPIIRALGSFDLDPCAAPEPRPWDTATTHWTERGLEQDWFGRVWLNPPYDRYTIHSWIGKAVEHANVMGLLFARTDTEVWQDQIFARAHGVLFLRGRIFFHLPDGTRAPDNAGAPLALIAFNESNWDVLAASSVLGRRVPLRS